MDRQTGCNKYKRGGGYSVIWKKGIMHFLTYSIQVKYVVKIIMQNNCRYRKIFHQEIIFQDPLTLGSINMIMNFLNVFGKLKIFC